MSNAASRISHRRPAVLRLNASRAASGVKPTSSVILSLVARHRPPLRRLPLPHRLPLRRTNVMKENSSACTADSFHDFILILRFPSTPIGLGECSTLLYIRSHTDDSPLPYSPGGSTTLRIATFATVDCELESTAES